MHPYQKTKQPKQDAGVVDQLEERLFTNVNLTKYHQFLTGSKQGKSKFPRCCNLNGRSIPIDIPVINDKCTSIKCYFDGSALLDWLRAKDDDIKLYRKHEYRCPGCHFPRQTYDLISDIGLQYYIDSFRHKTSNLNLHSDYFCINEETNNEEEWEDEVSEAVDQAFRGLNKVVGEMRERNEILLHEEQSIKTTDSISKELEGMWKKFKFNGKSDVSLMIAQGKVTKDGIQTVIVGRDFNEDFTIYKSRQEMEERLQSTKIFFEMNMRMDDRVLILPRETLFFYSAKLLSFLAVTCLPGIETHKQVLAVLCGSLSDVVADTIIFQRITIKDFPVVNYGAVVQEDILYIAGGLFGEQFSSVIGRLKLDLASVKSTVEPIWNLKIPRLNCKLFVIRNDLYVLGGLQLKLEYGRRSLVNVESTERIDLKSAVQKEKEVKHEIFKSAILEGYNTLMLPCLQKTKQKTVQKTEQKSEQNTGAYQDYAIIIQHNQPPPGSKEPRFIKSCYVYQVKVEKKRQVEAKNNQVSCDQNKLTLVSSTWQDDASDSKSTTSGFEKKSEKPSSHHSQPKSLRESNVSSYKQADDGQLKLRYGYASEFYTDSYSAAQTIVRCRTYEAVALKFSVYACPSGENPSQENLRVECKELPIKFRN